MSDISYKIDSERLQDAPQAALARLAEDPNCTNANECREEQARRHEAEQLRRANLRDELRSNPFDPRTEVSADAHHVAKQLWIIFVALPVVFAVLYSILR